MTEQHGNVVGRDQAGGNIVHYHLDRRPGVLSRLIAEYEREVREDVVFREVVENLQFFGEPFDPSQRPSLEGKLRRGGREELLKQAKVEKEAFAKKLARNQLRESAQKLYVFLLSTIQMKFQAHIVPLIANNESKDAVDSAIARHVIEPVYDILDSNPLTISPQELRGMMFYLTGNCHLRWDIEE